MGDEIHTPLGFLRRGMSSLGRLTSDSPPAGSKTIPRIRAAVLISAVVLMLPGAWGHSVTVVEFAQLPAGLAAWQRGSLGIYRVCGPLSKWLYSLPAYVTGVRVDYPASVDLEVGARLEWDLGLRFQEQFGQRYWCIYRWSRLIPILVTILGGCLICEWSTRLFGVRAGLASLCVWCWTPPVLAHGSLVTSDMLSAVMLLLAARSFWAFLLAPRPGSALLAGLALGLAAVTKFTLLVIYPCWTALVIGRAVQLRGTRMVGTDARYNPSSQLVILGLTVLLFSLVGINALYLFGGFGVPLAKSLPGQCFLMQDLSRLDRQAETAWLLRLPSLLPLEFLRGLDCQLADTDRVQSAYLLGQNCLGGWWYWYLAASLIKIPLPALCLFSIALIGLPGAVRGRDRECWAALCLLIPAAEVAMVISSTTGTGTNAAFRYLIPCIASLCVFAGSGWSVGSDTKRSSTIVLLVWLAINAMSGVPDHLGWHNELGLAWDWWTGRPALIGDSLDWGQDLARLGTWVSRHSGAGTTSVFVTGKGDGESYGLSSPALAMSTSWESSAFLAVSANSLFGHAPEMAATIRGKHPSLDRELRAVLARQVPHERVGRTILIFRVKDVVSKRWPGVLPTSIDG